MNMVVLKLMLGLGILGHGVNMYCDRRLSIFPNGQIDYKSFKDLFQGDNAARLMEGVPEKVPMSAAVVGAFCVLLEVLGYASLGIYTYASDPILGGIMLFGCMIYGVLGSAYHVKEGFSEYLFVKMGRDDRAKEAMMYLQQGARILRVCAVGIMGLIVAYIVAVVTGTIGFPIWALVFTILPIVVAIFPFKIIGSLHIGAMVSMLGWMLLM